jgi:ribosomal protein L9
MTRASGLTRCRKATLQFERNVGEDQKLFGSVTNRDIADQLKKANIEIDHRWVHLETAVKALGKLRNRYQTRLVAAERQRLAS